VEKPVPKDLVEFRRKEQMNRLKEFLRNSLLPGRLSGKTERISTGPKEVND
jgi:hypothetical protein